MTILATALVMVMFAVQGAPVAPEVPSDGPPPNAEEQRALDGISKICEREIITDLKDAEQKAKPHALGGFIVPDGRGGTQKLSVRDYALYRIIDCFDREAGHNPLTIRFTVRKGPAYKS